MNTADVTVGYDLPPPSRDVAACAWCLRHFDSIVDLLVHVDTDHLASVAGRPERHGTEAA
jgi:hypothetical protein